MQAARRAALASSLSQTAVKTPTTIDYNRSFYDSDFDQLPAVEPRQTATASAHARASYQHFPEPRPTRHVDRHECSWVVPQSPVLTCLSDLESDESQDEDVGDITDAEELRKRARHHDLEAFKARKLAKDARREQDRQAERKYNNKATTHENAKEALNAKAAAIIFREKNRNRVRMTSLSIQTANDSMLATSRVARSVWLTFMACTFPKPSTM
jgi:hypothetical protein